MYYVHYIDHNKRLDEWVDETCLLPLSASAVSPGDGVDRKLSAEKDPNNPHQPHPHGMLKVTRNLKRRYDEIHHTAPAVEDLTPAEQTLEREHEEKTKVKNIQVRHGLRLS